MNIQFSGGIYVGQLHPQARLVQAETDAKHALMQAAVKRADQLEEQGVPANALVYIDRSKPQPILHYLVATGQDALTLRNDQSGKTFKTIYAKAMAGETDLPE